MYKKCTGFLIYSIVSMKLFELGRPSPPDLCGYRLEHSMYNVLGSKVELGVRTTPRPVHRDSRFPYQLRISL